MKKKPNIIVRILCFILFVLLLPVLLVAALIKAIIKHKKYKRWLKEGETGRRLILSSDITRIDLMEGYEFEEYLKCLFFYSDYNAEITKKSRDYGADLILTKGEETIVVQAKRYNKTVGSKCVSEIVGAKRHYNATDAWVITNSHFSMQAETLAKENEVRLIDRDELIEIANDVCEKLKIDNSSGQISFDNYSGSTYSESSFKI